MHDLEKALSSIPLDATAPVRDAIAALGRTEDVRFSPSGQRIALAAFTNRRIVVLDIDLVAAPSRVTITGGVQLASPSLDGPHGIDFIDDDNVVVTNRDGDAVIFVLPRGTPQVALREAQPIKTLRGGGKSLLDTPGSVAVTGVEHGLAELLVCNNYAHTVTRHLLDTTADYSLRREEVLLRRWLDIPDGIAVTLDRRWIAISNHMTHDVLVYENGSSLDEDTDPAGILRGVHYPHGLRFGADGRYLFVADAGAPYLQIFTCGVDGWHGVAHPAASVRIMDDAVFRRGAQRPDEGGPKGIDLDHGMRVLVASSTHQPLAFFDVREMSARVAEATNGLLRQQNALNVAYELHYIREAREARVNAEEAEHMRASRSWRLTAPLRRIFDVLRKDRS